MRVGLPAYGQVSSAETAAGEAVTREESAPGTSTLPAPCSYTPAPSTGSAAPMSAALSCCASQSGCRCLRMAAAPETCGVAMEVPLIVA